MADPALTLTAWLRYDLIRRLLARADGVRTVLEIGTGQGALGARLAERYAYTGLELDETSFRIAASRIESRGGRVIHGDVAQLPADTVFDLVCAFEVLEHIEDDRTVLRAWRARLGTGGWLLLSVPGFARRFGPWDVKAAHYRRYEREGLAELIKAAGFESPLVWAYGFPLGNLTEAVRHWVAGRGPNNSSMDERTRASGRALQPTDRWGWLTRLISAPFRPLQRPFRETHLGVGLVALARRRD